MMLLLNKALLNPNAIGNMEEMRVILKSCVCVEKLAGLLKNGEVNKNHHFSRNHRYEKV